MSQELRVKGKKQRAKSEKPSQKAGAAEETAAMRLARPLPLPLPIHATIQRHC